MNEKLQETYNSISNVFSGDQVKTAVESLSTFKDRLKLIDYIIQRRKEIEQTNYSAKISKYAHIFKRMIHRHRQSRQARQSHSIAQEGKEQLNASTGEENKFKLEMIMQLFRSPGDKLQAFADTERVELSHKPFSRQQSPLISPNLRLHRRNALIVDAAKEEQRSSGRRLSSTKRFFKAKRFFTEKDPLQVEQQVENEIFQFLSQNKQMTQRQKDQFLRMNDRSQLMMLMESKIKHQLNLQDYYQQQLAIKQFYQVKNVFPKIHQNYQSQTKIKLGPVSGQTSPNGQNRKSRQMYFTPLKKKVVTVNEDSYVSYTEIELNKLYNQSATVQKSMRNIQLKTQQMENSLVTTNKDIIDVSNKKLYSQK